MKFLSILVIVFVLQGFVQAQQTEAQKNPFLDSSKEAKNEEKIESRFVGRVKWVKREGMWEGEAVPVGFDQHFLVAVDILSIEKPFKPFDHKGQVVLLVHSPSRLFKVVDPNRKKFAFTITGVLRDEKPIYTFAEADKYTKSHKEEIPHQKTTANFEKASQRDEGDYEIYDFRSMNRNFNDMVALVHTEYPEAIRSAAANRLRVVDHTNPILFELFDDPNADVRMAAINAVAVKYYVDEKAKVCPMELIRALFDKNEQVRSLAGCYVGVFDELPRESLPLLVKALESQDRLIQHNVAGIFDKFGDAAKDAVPNLTKALEYKDPWVRHNATVSLWHITHDPKLFLRTNLDILSKHTVTEDGNNFTPEAITGSFIIMIGKEAPKEVGQALIDFLADSSPNIRASAVRSLRALAIDDKKAKSVLQELKTEEVLRKLLKDEDEEVQREALFALEKILE
jgi:HEAT repeat protein